MNESCKMLLLIVEYFFHSFVLVSVCYYKV